MFPIVIPELPPHREVDISINLVRGVTLESKAPYKMRTPELVELNLELKYMLDKRYTGPSVSLGVQKCCL